MSPPIEIYTGFHYRKTRCAYMSRRSKLKGEPPLAQTDRAGSATGHSAMGSLAEPVSPSD
jgi:hypothetical protein